MDLRRHKRFPVHFHSGFTSSKASESVGTILDLSKKGCVIEITSRAYGGMPITLRIDVPGAVSPIRIEKAAVRWNRGGKVGVDFSTVAPPDQERLDQLLK